MAFAVGLSGQAHSGRRRGRAACRLHVCSQQDLASQPWNGVLVPSPHTGPLARAWDSPLRTFLRASVS